MEPGSTQSIEFLEHAQQVIDDSFYTDYAQFVEFKWQMTKFKVQLIAAYQTVFTIIFNTFVVYQRKPSLALVILILLIPLLILFLM